MASRPAPQLSCSTCGASGFSSPIALRAHRKRCIPVQTPAVESTAAEEGSGALAESAKDKALRWTPPTEWAKIREDEKVPGTLDLTDAGSILLSPQAGKYKDKPREPSKPLNHHPVPRNLDDEWSLEKPPEVVTAPDRRARCV